MVSECILQGPQIKDPSTPFSPHIYMGSQTEACASDITRDQYSTFTDCWTTITHTALLLGCQFNVCGLINNTINSSDSGVASDRELVNEALQRICSEGFQPNLMQYPGILPWGTERPGQSVMTNKCFFILCVSFNDAVECSDHIALITNK